MIEEHFNIEPLEPKYFGEVAKYYRHNDNGAKFGLITSVSQSFCSTCTRARLSSDGKFYGCLFATVDGFNVKAFMRSGATDEELKELTKNRKTEDLQRYKGLGEMNPEQLWETTMNPATRIMIKVTMEDAMKADAIFNVLMGEEIAPRREFIEKNAKSVRNLDV